MPAKTKRKKDRDIEKSLPVENFVDTLRRLADALESGTSFVVQVKGERIKVPKRAEISIEHEREGGSEEVEFQLKWSRASSGKRAAKD